MQIDSLSPFMCLFLCLCLKNTSQIADFKTAYPTLFSLKFIFNNNCFLEIVFFCPYKGFFFGYLNGRFASTNFICTDRQ